jgi:hypothetical protein
MFTIDADTPYISTGVDEFKKDPTSAYADVNASERGFDARALNDSALNLNIKDASQVGDTYGIFNDKDLDGDKDDDLYVKKITP